MSEEVKKKKVGRPATGKANHISVYVSDTEKEKLQKMADDLGLSLSTYLKFAGLNFKG